MHYKTIALTAVLAVCVSFIGTQIFSDNAGRTGQTAAAASILERGELRVGYIVYPPEAMVKDPNTGELSGICHDVLEAAGKNLGLRVTWVEEVNWGTMIEGLHARRYDILSCAWSNAERAKGADAVGPIFFNAIAAYARATDHRFTDLAQLNDRRVIISIVDGQASAFLAATQFPNARTISLPEDTSPTQPLLDVKAGKADATFADTGFAEEFLVHNPHAIRNVSPKRPIAVFPVVYLVDKDESALASMLNTAVEGLLNDGTVDSLIRKYQKYPDSIYPVSKPYAAPLP